MRSEIDAIAFDIDGTLYPNWSLYRRLLPFLARNARFLAGFGRVRRRIRDWQSAHPGVPRPDFFAWQAELLAEELDCGVETARKRLHDGVYEGWKPIFRKVRPYPHLKESFAALRESGLKVGILSDFLPSQKENLWGLEPLCDVVMGAEETGALKPSPIPFMAFAKAIGVAPGRILYVGNSVESDVRGASAAGMKTACIVNPVALALGFRAPGADISFSSYRKLTAIVLK